MSNHLESTLSYMWLKDLKKQNFENKKITLLGSGLMAESYCAVLNQLKIHNVTIISNSSKNKNKFSKQFHFKNFLSGGYEKNLPKIDQQDLVIVSLPTPLLLDATKKLLKLGHDNILIEKPASLSSNNLFNLFKKIKNQNVRVAYNRLLYPSFLKSKSIFENEKILSCHFDFTEWIHKINFNKYAPEVYQHWGINNSLHVISMAFELIGFPKKLKSYQNGFLKWHKTGSIFVGSGVSVCDIPFTYHADWQSAGRWNIEIMTNKNKYRLSPLEELHFCKKGEVNWNKIPLKSSFPRAKMGIAEEISSMLSDNEEIRHYLPSLKKVYSYNKIAQRIFGYKDS